MPSLASQAAVHAPLTQALGFTSKAGRLCCATPRWCCRWGRLSLSVAAAARSRWPQVCWLCSRCCPVLAAAGRQALLAHCRWYFHSPCTGNGPQPASNRQQVRWRRHPTRPPAGEQRCVPSRAVVWRFFAVQPRLCHRKLQVRSHISHMADVARMTHASSGLVSGTLPEAAAWSSLSCRSLRVTAGALWCWLLVWA